MDKDFDDISLTLIVIASCVGFILLVSIFGYWKTESEFWLCTLGVSGIAEIILFPILMVRLVKYEYIK